jgi:lipoprotein-releasing system ATP-binding protein
MDVLLALDKVTKRYDSPDGQRIAPVLDEVCLQVASGESLAITGPSGSGKSTLLNLMGALDRPTSGSIQLSGRDLAQLADHDLAKVRNADIGFVFQLHHLLPQCTVLENVLIPTLARPQATRPNGATAPNDAWPRARQLIHRVGLENRAHYRPGQLSGGERQRVALVRALINRPRLVLADEPTGSLDQAAADDLIQLLVELNQEEGVTLVLVTHAVDLARRMRHQYTLHHGKLEKW